MDLKAKEEKFIMENETFEMLKALYDFQAVYPKTISFDEGEYFILHQTSSRQRNWWQIVNGKGLIGFVPSNYVKKVTVEPAFLLAFLDSSIESLKQSSKEEINNIIARDLLITHLEEKKSNLEQILVRGFEYLQIKLEECSSLHSFPLEKDVNSRMKYCRKYCNRRRNHMKRKMNVKMATLQYKNFALSQKIDELIAFQQQLLEYHLRDTVYVYGIPNENEAILRSAIVKLFEMIGVENGDIILSMFRRKIQSRPMTIVQLNNEQFKDEVLAKMQKFGEVLLNQIMSDVTDKNIVVIADPLNLFVRREMDWNRESPYRDGKNIGNGSIMHIETEAQNHVEDSSQNEDESKSSSQENNSKHKQKHEVAKKSMSSPAVGAVGNVPQLIQESPSMSVLTSKLEDISLTSPSNPDTSLLSEISSGETATATTTITTTTTDPTSGATIITKELEDEEVPISKSGDESKDATGDDTDDQQKSDKKDSEIAPIPNGSCVTDVKHEVIVEEQDVYQIVESIRKNTNLSHELACAALRVVISEMEVLLPSSVVKYLEPIAMHLTSPLTAPDNLLGQTYDAQRLRIIFQDLADCKNDSQQRSWMLYEDETEITHYLTELVRILTDADPKICRYEMSCDHYQSIVNLVLYYQMENRWSIRLLLLKAFKAMMMLDVAAVDVLISSVLPLELVQDMMSNAKNVDKLIEFSETLTMTFSTGHKMPITHQEHIKTDFIIFLLNFIENSPDTDEAELLPDLLINLILALNLQFDGVSENVVIEAMQQLKVCKIFTEKILLLINREEDPVAVFKHTKPPVNSVLKIFVDLFSIPETTTLFYTNDNKVLIDILVRQLSDLSAGDPIRKWYLELCRRILRNTNYAEHLHRRADLMKIFTRIFCEETEYSAGDQQIVREILREFPNMIFEL